MDQRIDSGIVTILTYWVLQTSIALKFLRSYNNKSDLPAICWRVH